MEHARREPVDSPNGTAQEGDDHLAELNKRIVALGDPMLVPVACALGTAAFRRRSNIELVGEDLDDLAALVTDAARFLSERRPGEIALRVTQPTDEGGVGIDINTDDGPFLVSTLSAELSRQGLNIRDLLHPILGVERDEEGHVRRITAARHAEHRESWIHVRLAERLDTDERTRLQEVLSAVMHDAQRVTEDFAQLKERVRDMAREVEDNGDTKFSSEVAGEAAAFLRWLLDDHFVLMGARDYALIHDEDGEPVLEAEVGSELGVLTEGGSATYTASSVADHPGLPAQGDQESLLVVSRTAERSTVHRNERMICVTLRRVDGDVFVGERRLLGLLSQKAFAQPATSIPVLRRKLRRILEDEDVVDHSHDERALRTLFEAIPKHELFTVPTQDLRQALVDLLESQKRQSVRLTVRPEYGGASALVTVPRERFNAELRRRVQQLLVDRLGAESVDYHLSLTEGDQALMHFTLNTAEQTPDVRLDELQRKVVELARSWQDRLRGALPPADAEIAERWSAALPQTYTAATTPAEAVGDVAQLERLLSGDGDVRVRVIRSAADRLRVKLFKRGEGIELSGVIPMLESMGLVAIEEVPHRIELSDTDGGGVLHIHDVEVRGGGGAMDLRGDIDGDRLSAALLAVWSGEAAADSLNRLVLLADLDWHDVSVLRAYRRYRRQVGTSFTENYQNEALCQYPDIAHALVELFDARFSPDPPSVGQGPDRKNPEVAADDARSRVVEGLDNVHRLDQDRILRGYLGLVDATLRTNHYMRPRRAWLSLKLDSSRVPDLPKPIPYREIFVYSTDMEGVHLRGGAIARGGLRWSDRLEDVRTEVLSLMKAQVTKNSMIVPTGSKGGFVLKHPPADADALRAGVREQYEVFIRGMLDLTDNVVDGKVVPPERVIREDDDDPYLVVAADRGTATFSDLANGISDEYGYWLRDAFASGGSHGYDHKEMGITARGTWETVRRHFYELDVDVQSEPITISGIGDMSGDVFGNGLLRSKTVELVAAFDHRDIFIDPTPDREASFHERQRLYDTPRSTWQDYDRDIISSGGGVWPRSVKSIELSDEMREMLRVEDEHMSPPALIRAILRAPVDLLFAGGVGTFVKSSKETNDGVGDRANDAIRVNAADVGARVIGEGGNLAVTQRGRIAYARRGGRINLDAIDNAAGVATSDAEVNLKILLQLALDRDEIDEQERDQVLTDVREDVARSVLHSVWRQAWAISREVAISPGGMEAYEQLLTDLEESGRADRRVDVLPTTEEMQRRREAGAGLTRPELGTLLGASKRDLITRLMNSDVPDDPALRPLLVNAFPAAVSERFDHLLDDHRLRRELIATRLAGEIVDRLGITYVSRTAHERGCMAADVASGYWVARQVIDASEHWAAIDELEGTIVPALQLDLTAEIDSLMDACTRAYLREMPVASMSDLIEVDRAALSRLCEYVLELAGSHAALRAGRIGRWVDVGVEQDLAEEIALLAELTLAPDVAAVARRLERSVHAVADAFISVTDRLPLDTLHQKLQTVTPVGNWERWQTRALVDELRDLRRQIATAALAYDQAPDGGDGAAAVDRYLAERETVTERVSSLMKRLNAESEVGLPAVTVVVTALRGIID